jgi:hypothetical protein
MSWHHSTLTFTVTILGAHHQNATRLLKGKVAANSEAANVKATADSVRTDMSAATDGADMTASPNTVGAYMNPTTNRAAVLSVIRVLNVIRGLNVIGVWHRRSEATREVLGFWSLIRISGTLHSSNQSKNEETHFGIVNKGVWAERASIVFCSSGWKD